MTNEKDPAEQLRETAEGLEATAEHVKELADEVDEGPASSTLPDPEPSALPPFDGAITVDRHGEPEPDGGDRY